MSKENQEALQEPLIPKQVPVERKAGRDKLTTQAALTLMGGFSLEVMIGTQFAWGSISPYVTGYYRDLGSDVRHKDFYSILPFIVIFSTLTFPFGMYLADKFHPKLVFSLGGLFGIVMTLLASVSRSPTVFFWLYSGGFGICKGCLYPSALYSAWTHLPKRKGLASGIIVSGMGVGACIFSLVTQRIVNPDNIPTEVREVEPGIFENYFPSEVNSAVPHMFRTLCIIWFCILVFAFITMTVYEKPPDYKGSSSLCAHLDALDGTEMTPERWAEENIPTIDLLMSKEFLLLFVNFVFFIFYGYFVINIYKLYGAETINDDFILTIIGSVGALVNGGMRIFWSTLLDYYSFRFVFGILICIQLVLVWLIQILTFNQWLFMLAVCMSMQCEGAVASILPTQTLTTFGVRRGHLVYSFMFSAFGVSSFLGAFLMAFFFDYIGYFGMFLICFLMTIISLFLTLIYGDMRFDFVNGMGDRMEQYETEYKAVNALEGKLEKQEGTGSETQHTKDE